MTVTANLQGLIDVARWAQWLLNHWLDAVALFWKTVLFFLPQLTVDDASLLAILLFLAMNIAACVRRVHAANPIWATLASLMAGGAIVGSIYLSAFDRVMSNEPGLSGKIFDLLWAKLLAPAFGIDIRNSLYPEDSLPIVLGSSLVVLAVGLIVLLSVATFSMRWLDISIDTRRLFSRFTRIILGIALLVALGWGYEQFEGLVAAA